MSPETRPQQADARQTGYMPQLDALRFVAVAGVLIAHLWRFDIFPGFLSLFDWANAGVRLFFVLSGYLITGILIRSREMAQDGRGSSWFHIGRFYIRRFLRIFPIYYLVVAVVVVIGLETARSVWPWLVTYTTNYYIFDHQKWLGHMGHFWTLAVEEQFYLFWPWLVIFLPRRRLSWVLGGLILAAPLFRLFLVRNYYADVAREVTTGTHTLACIDSLALGSLLSIVLFRHPHPERVYRFLDRVVLPVGLVGFALVYWINYTRHQLFIVYPLENLFLSIFFVWLVARAAMGFKGPLGKALELKPLVYLGRITYGIYVYHNFMPLLVLPALQWIGIDIPGRSFRAFLVGSLATILVAALSWELFEKRINNLKRYFEYQKAPPAEPLEPKELAEPLP